MVFPQVLPPVLSAIPGTQLQPLAAEVKLCCCNASEIQSARKMTLLWCGGGPPVLEDSLEGGLIATKECLFIGSYGDEFPQWMRVAKRVKMRGSSYLPKIEEDIKRFLLHCYQDPKVYSLLVHEDKPGCQQPKQFYLKVISDFLHGCVQPGGKLRIWTVASVTSLRPLLSKSPERGPSALYENT